MQVHAENCKDFNSKVGQSGWQTPPCIGLLKYIDFMLLGCLATSRMPVTTSPPGADRITGNCRPEAGAEAGPWWWWWWGNTIVRLSTGLGSSFAFQKVGSAPSPSPSLAGQAQRVRCLAVTRRAGLDWTEQLHTSLHNQRGSLQSEGEKLLGSMGEGMRHAAAPQINSSFLLQSPLMPSQGFMLP